MYMGPTHEGERSVEWANRSLKSSSLMLQSHIPGSGLGLPRRIPVHFFPLNRMKRDDFHHFYFAVLLRCYARAHVCLYRCYYGSSQCHKGLSRRRPSSSRWSHSSSRWRHGSSRDELGVLPAQTVATLLYCRDSQASRVCPSGGRPGYRASRRC